ncbi:MAG: hypothetical protein ACPL4H_08430, partial [Anaerolineales bacterium]
VAILGESADPGTEALVRALWNAYRPRVIAAIAKYPPPPDAPLLLQDRPLLNGQPTAYVCQNFMCKEPLNRPHDLLIQLGEENHS